MSRVLIIEDEVEIADLEPTVTDQALHEHNNVSYQQHIAIVDAIRRHDPDEADRALQSHLNSVSATWHAFGQTTNKKK